MSVRVRVRMSVRVRVISLGKASWAVSVPLAAALSLPLVHTTVSI